MKTIVRIFAFLLLATTASLGAVAAYQDEPAPPPTNLSVSDLQDSEGNQLGYAIVFQDDEGATGVGIVARGLTPGSHGIHIHETGNCDPAGEKTFEQAGAHRLEVDVPVIARPIFDDRVVSEETRAAVAGTRLDALVVRGKEKRAVAAE